MKLKKLAILVAFLTLPLAALAQEQPLTPQQKEKQMYENIQKEVDRLAESLGLADWQIFYADSILTHNYKAMADEVEALSSSKVSNADLYYSTQDKWMEANYQAFKKILNEQQWAKYLKSGAERAKKARDKREAKRK